MAGPLRGDDAGGMTENTTQSAPPEGPSFLDDSFDRLRRSGYERDTDARWFGGVCSGLAHRLGVDPVLVRAAAVVLAFVGGIGLTAYVVLWLVMPDRNGEILAERAVRRGEAGAIALLAPRGVPRARRHLLAGPRQRLGRSPVAHPRGRRRLVRPQPGPRHRHTLTSLSRPTARPHPLRQETPCQHPPPPRPPAMAAAAPPAPTAPYGRPAPYGAPAGQYPGPYGGRPTPPVPPRPVGPPPPPRPRRRRPSAFVGLISLGIAMVGLGLGAALDGPVGFPGSAATLGFLIGLVGVSLVVLALGISGRASGFSGVLTVILGMLLLISAAASRVEVTDGLGDRTWTPVPTTGVTSYQLGAGEATLDLRQLDSAAASTMPQRITVEMGAGDLVILVPDGLDTQVDANVGLGDITHRGGIDGTDTSGRDQSSTTIIGVPPVQVVVDAQLGLGQITIQEQ